MRGIADWCGMVKLGELALSSGLFVQVHPYQLPRRFNESVDHGLQSAGT